MNNIHILLTVLFLFQVSCQSPANQTINHNTNTTELSQAYPSLPVELYANMVEQVNQGEIIFYGDVPFSLSIDEAGCKSYFKSIVNSTVTDPDCATAVGRIFFSHDTESVIDAEIYMSEECSYLLFYADHAQYANPLQGEAAFFLQTMLDPAKRPTRPN